jgi:hypothetical protein
MEMLVRQTKGDCGVCIISLKRNNTQWVPYTGLTTPTSTKTGGPRKW